MPNIQYFFVIGNLALKRIIFTAVFLLVGSFAHAADYSNKSNAELAKELANPNTPLASMKFKTQYRTYKGDLKDADDQDSTTVLFQPTLPFPMADDNTLYGKAGCTLVTRSAYTQAW